MSVSKKRVHTKRTTLHFFVRNGERFPLLLETNNALRIFMVLSETKSALMITNPDLFSICFFGRLDFFFSGDITKHFGQHDSGFGRDDYRAR